MIEIIQQRLDQYQSETAIAEEQALKEIIQEIALYGLWRAGFFEQAAFQGGTSLRILYQLPRFSEDLDFILIKSEEPVFSWHRYKESLLDTFTEFGLEMTVSGKDQMDKRVQQAILKNDSMTNQLTVAFPALIDGLHLKSSWKLMSIRRNSAPFREATLISRWISKSVIRIFRVTSP